MSPPHSPERRGFGPWRGRLELRAQKQQLGVSDSPLRLAEREFSLSCARRLSRSVSTQPLVISTFPLGWQKYFHSGTHFALSDLDFFYFWDCCSGNLRKLLAMVHSVYCTTAASTNIYQHLSRGRWVSPWSVWAAEGETKLLRLWRRPSNEALRSRSEYQITHSDIEFCLRRGCCQFNAHSLTETHKHNLVPGLVAWQCARHEAWRPSGAI